MRNLRTQKKNYNKLIIIRHSGKKNAQKFCQFRKKIYLCTRKNSHSSPQKEF